MQDLYSTDPAVKICLGTDHALQGMTNREWTLLFLNGFFLLAALCESKSRKEWNEARGEGRCFLQAALLSLKFSKLNNVLANVLHKNLRTAVPTNDLQKNLRTEIPTNVLQYM